MHSVKIHPFILLSLFFSSISIGMYVFWYVCISKLC